MNQSITKKITGCRRPLDLPQTVHLITITGVLRDSAMMTSSNGNIFRVTGPLCGEFTGHRGALMFSLICAWTNLWTNNRDAGDLRRHRAQYDATVMAYCRWCDTMVMVEPSRWLLMTSWHQFGARSPATATLMHAGRHTSGVNGFSEC